jgi:hypothetical protein
MSRAVGDIVQDSCASGVLDGCFDVVVDACRSQQPVQAAFVDPDSCLWR